MPSTEEERASVARIRRTLAGIRSEWAHASPEQPFYACARLAETTGQPLVDFAFDFVRSHHRRTTRAPPSAS